MMEICMFGTAKCGKHLEAPRSGEACPNSARSSLWSCKFSAKSKSYHRLGLLFFPYMALGKGIICLCLFVLLSKHASACCFHSPRCKVLQWAPAPRCQLPAPALSPPTASPCSRCCLCSPAAVPGRANEPPLRLSAANVSGCYGMKCAI